jgi:pyridoxine/pyridoxamine 5'-phosphate oxidase
LDLRGQVIESLGAILLQLALADPEALRLATVAAHAQPEERLTGLRPFKLHDCVHEVIASAQLY